jgi:branched-chain amino acid transport system substrate-binding protein
MSLVKLSRREFCLGTGVAACTFLLGTRRALGTAGGPVQIGFMLPEHGPFADEARSLLLGFDLFMKQRGAGGIECELLHRDTGPNDENALEALADLVINRQVQFLVSPLSIDGCEKILRGAAGSDTIVFLTNPSVRLAGSELCLRTSFRVCANTFQSAQPLAPWVIRNLGLKVFITGDDDILGNEYADAFAYGFEKAGGQFAERVMVPSGSDKTQSVLEAIGKSGADVVFASFSGSSAAVCLKAFREFPADLKPQLVGPESLTSYPKTLRETGKYANGLRSLTSLTDYAGLTEKIKQVLGREPVNALRAAEGYDLGNVIFAALDRVGSGPRDAAALVSVLAEIRVEGPRGTLLFDHNHEPVLNMMVQEWEDRSQGFEPKIVEKLGPVRSPDFGCGRVGFPKRPESDFKDEDAIWEERNE